MYDREEEDEQEDEDDGDCLPEGSVGGCHLAA